MGQKKAYQVSYTTPGNEECSPSVRSVLVIATGIVEAAKEAENGRRAGEGVGIGEVSTPVVLL